MGGGAGGAGAAEGELLAGEGEADAGAQVGGEGGEGIVGDLLDRTAAGADEVVVGVVDRVVHGPSLAQVDPGDDAQLLQGVERAVDRRQRQPRVVGPEGGGQLVGRDVVVVAGQDGGDDGPPAVGDPAAGLPQGGEGGVDARPVRLGRRVVRVGRRVRVAVRSDLPSLAPRARRYGPCMRAAVYDETGPPEVLHLAEIPDPELTPKGVLIQVEAISIEGGDTLNRLGGAMAGHPHIVGYQCGGTILAVGDEVTDRQVGQRVVATMPHGSHAELVAVHAGQTWVVPDGLDLTLAACVPIAFGTADDCLFEFGRLQPGESVLVQAGAGGVGLAAIQLAKRAGATVLATASSDDRLARLTDFGLDHGINYRDEDLVDAVRRATDGRGVDLVVESVGTTLAASVRSLAYRGRVAYVGDAGRGSEPFDVCVLKEQNQTITGVFLGAELFAGPRAHANIERLIGLVADGELAVVVDSTFPLEDAAAAHAHVESRRAFGRVVITP